MSLACEDLDEVAAICYYGRSGSIFLQSLLDSHPRVLMVPGHYLMAFFQQYEHRWSQTPRSDIADVIAKDFPCLFNARDTTAIPWVGERPGLSLAFDKLGPERQECLGVDRESFCRALRRAVQAQPDPVPRKALFQAIHIAYAQALGQTLPTRPLIVFALHSPMQMLARGLAQDFPGAKVLLTVREPLRSMASYLRVYQGRTGVYLSIVATNALAGGWPLAPELAPRSFAIRLEDLHALPREVMQAVADFLGLDWHDCLLESTFDGRKWWNVPDSKPMSGFDRTHGLAGAPEVFSPFDVWRLQRLLASKYRRWSYVMETEGAPMPPDPLPDALAWTSWPVLRKLEVTRRFGAAVASVWSALAQPARTGSGTDAFRAALARPFHLERYFLPASLRELGRSSGIAISAVESWLLGRGLTQPTEPFRRPAVPFAVGENGRDALSARRSLIEYWDETADKKLGPQDEVGLLPLSVPHVPRRVTHCPI